MRTQNGYSDFISFEAGDARRLSFSMAQLIRQAVEVYYY